MKSFLVDSDARADLKNVIDEFDDFFIELTHIWSSCRPAYYKKLPLEFVRLLDSACDILTCQKDEDTDCQCIEPLLEPYDFCIFHTFERGTEVFYKDELWTVIAIHMGLVNITRGNYSTAVLPDELSLKEGF